MSAQIHAVSASLPVAATASTVAIVAGNAPTLRQLGSGTLLSVADRAFVVTAAHVIRYASKEHMTLGISGGDDGRIIETSETWLLSPMISENPSEDVHDVAIYPFPAEQVSKLHGAQFIRIGDVSFEHDLSHRYLVIIGFPAMWSTVSNADHESVEIRPLQYGTDTYSGSKAGLKGYDESFHFLLNASPDELVDQSGEPTRLRTRNDFPANMPEDLTGISGCSVWSIGDLRSLPTKWSQKDSRLVGVQTGFYAGVRAIKATRWNVVTTLLRSAYPDLRPVLEFYELYRPGAHQSQKSNLSVGH